MALIDAQYLIFDLDGTIIDSIPGIVESFKYCFKKNQMETPSEKNIIELIGSPLDYIFNTLVPGLEEEKLKNLIHDYRAHYIVHGIKNANLFDGCMETLTELKKRGKKMCIATNKPEIFVQKIVEKNKIKPLFEFILANKIENDTVKYTKLQLIKKAAEKFGKIRPAVIGDSQEDISSAKNLGFIAIASAYGAAPLQKLLAEQPDVVIRKINELCFVLN